VTVTADLTEHVRALGHVVERGDVRRWIADLDAAGPEGRAALSTTFTDPSLVALANLVDTYGGAAVLAAIETEADCLWRDRVDSARGGGL
jgi:hypothetical protein